VSTEEGENSVLVRDCWRGDLNLIRNRLSDVAREILFTITNEGCMMIGQNLLQHFIRL
jgi:hypothetical protein